MPAAFSICLICEPESIVYCDAIDFALEALVLYNILSEIQLTGCQPLNV
jgi:hypothetical protein